MKFRTIALIGLGVLGYAHSAEAAQETFGASNTVPNSAQIPPEQVPTAPLVDTPDFVPAQDQPADTDSAVQPATLNPENSVSDSIDNGPNSLAQPSLISSETAVANGAAGERGDEKAEANASYDNSEENTAGTFNGNYYAIFYGPGLQNPSSYQPTAYGANDLDRPVLLKNFMGLGYNATNEIAITPTAYWTYAAGPGQGVNMRDPFLRVSDSSLYKNERGTNLYSDIRFHFPITSLSRDADLRAGIQNFNVLSQEIEGTRFGLGFYLSERVNFFGSQGSGNDLELYAAPNASYQVSPSLSVLVLYEMQVSHLYGQPAFHFNNDGTDLEPGVVWNITPSVLFNPYFNFTTGGAISLRSTSLGALLSWNMF